MNENSTIKRPKRPRDINELAAQIVAEAVGDVEPYYPKDKNPAAVELGRLGGLKGGKARAKKINSEARRIFTKKSEVPMSKTICLFNHKGGVSKTTTAFNLGWALADHNKKVLLVDLDSQCNLTGLVLGFNAVDDDKMSSFYESRKNLTLKPIVASLINGEQPDQIIQQEKSTIFKTLNNNLFLLPGYIDISDLDSLISVSLKIARGVPVTKYVPSNLPKVLQLISDKFNIDYTIYDLSPNISGLNEVILMSSDYFILPTSPDYFCLQAIYSIDKTIPKWHKEIEIFKEVNELESKTYAIKNHPKFIGTIQQRYRPRYNKPGKSFQNWMDEIKNTINKCLIPTLEAIDCIIPLADIKMALKGTDLSPYDLAHIPDFNSLIAISQQLTKPIFALTDEDIVNTGNVFGYAAETMQKSRDNFLEIFNGLADRILLLTDK